MIFPCPVHNNESGRNIAKEVIKEIPALILGGEKFFLFPPCPRRTFVITHEMCNFNSLKMLLAHGNACVFF